MTVERLKDVAEAELRLGKIRLGGQCLLKVEDRRVGPDEFRKEGTEAAMRAGKARVDRQRPPEVRDRFLAPALLFVYCGQPAQRAKMLPLDRQNATVAASPDRQLHQDGSFAHGSHHAVIPHADRAPPQPTLKAFANR
jgi:hypothetical protein